MQRNLKHLQLLSNFFSNEQCKERFVFWFKCFVLSLDPDTLSLEELHECSLVGGFEFCVELAIQAALSGFECRRVLCPGCDFPLLSEHICFENVCSFCTAPYSCPEAVGNPLGDRIHIKQDLLNRFDEVCSRVGRILVGSYDQRNESSLFELLVFAQYGMYYDKSDGLGCSNSMEFNVELVDPKCKPVCHELRRYNQVKLRFIDDEVKQMRELGVIDEYLGAWQSSVVVAPKPGPGQKLRFCVDLRDVNDCSKSIKYPLPTIEEIVHSLGDKAKVFCKLDLAKGFWQVPVGQKSQQYLAFVTRKGTWKFIRMPFGHKNAPAVFQAMMQKILEEELYVMCFVYIDDVVVYGKDEEECLANCKRVLELIFADNLKCNALKCEFLLRRVEILGHVVEDGMLYAKADKLQGLKDLKIPTTRTEIRSLYGLLSFFRRFVKNFSAKCKPISTMMKDDVEITWSSVQQVALVSLVDEIVSCGLQLPLYEKEFIVTTDFSYNGIGGMLSQMVDGVERPVMFCSRVLAPSEVNYAPTEGEALAILFALKRFAFVLYGQRVIIRTDHRPLLFIKGGMEHNKKLARWWMLLQDFDYTIEYVAGKANLVADGLSRLTTNVEEVGDLDTLGSSLPMLTQSVISVCQDCQEEVKTCAKCKMEFCVKCHACTDVTLPFVYCQECKVKLDDSDASMNLDLLKVLVMQDSQALVSEFGVTKFLTL